MKTLTPQEKREARRKVLAKQFSTLKKATDWSDKKVASFIGEVAGIKAETVLEATTK